MKKIYFTMKVPYFLRVFISLVLLLSSVNATALTCPGPQDFVRNSGALWGWSWDLRSDRLADFTSPFHAWEFYSPYEKDFSPDYPLEAKVYFIDIMQDKIITKLYCEYKLAGGEIMSVQTTLRFLSEDEFARINNSWEKTVKQGYRRWRNTFGYKCSTTAGAPDKCSVNFSD